MSCEKVFATIDALYDKYVKVFEDVCNIESPTLYKEGVDAVGKYFATLARECGFDVEVFEQSVSGDVVCITMNPDAKGKPVCISGHTDTVHPVGSFGTPAVRIEGDKIYGPGVTDCKGGVVAGFMAMEALLRCGFDKRPVRLLLQSDEEVGSCTSNKETINYICERSKDAIAFLNLEGHDTGEVCIVRKGIATFNFVIKGIEAHASRCATSGASAIAEAAHKILELEKLKDNEGLTCSCGLIQGGTAVNTVPGFCEFKVNVRFATREQLEWVSGYVKEIADKSYIDGCTCEVTQVSYRVAMEYADRNMALVETMNDIFAANGLPILQAVKRNGGSDAADVTAYGIPCVDSIGVSGGDIHNPGEWSYLPSLLESAKRIAAVTAELDEKTLLEKQKNIRPDVKKGRGI